jgi:AcrR family transcriptional regulator
MAKRAYSSPVRSAAAAARRAQVIAAAERLLREPGNAAAVSMEAVAVTAGVTRLTVYKQFGARRGLLEAVFDHLAAQGGLSRIPEAMMIDEPRRALSRLVEIFCAFWAGEPAIGGLMGAASADPEFAEALGARNERRRLAIDVLIGRLAGAAPAHRRRDAVDLIFTLTSHAAYWSLRPSRSDAEVRTLLIAACADAAKRAAES